MLLCATALLAVGCSKKSQSSEAPAAPPSTQPDASQPAPATQPTEVNSGPAVAASTTNGLPDVRPLNGALMEWVMQNQRRPANFEEFAASANIRIPPLPPGKKYIFNGRGLISIVDR